jgi:NADH:ubiquinone oxidoreductase subunit 2 (subunit N)
MGAFPVLFVCSGGKEKSHDSTIYLTMLGLLLAGIAIPIAGYGDLFWGAFVVDKYAVFFKIIFLAAAFFAAASSSDLMRKLQADHGRVLPRDVRHGRGAGRRALPRIRAASNEP